MRQLCLFILFAALCHGVSKATECSGRGRFPNNDADDCRGYTMCLLGGANGFTQYKLTCPIGFVYSHLEQQCTNATSYQCLPSFVCNITGNFASPLSKNCSSYITCPEGLNGIAMAREVGCPIEQVFDPQAGCVNSTVFKCSTLEEKITTVIEEVLSSTEGLVPSGTTEPIGQVTGVNEFQISSNVSINSAFKVSAKRALMYVVLIFVYFN